MHTFWEKVGVLGPIYRLVGRGLSDGDIANKLNIDETRVQSCISWMMHFLQFTTRAELALHACPAPSGVWPDGLPSKNGGT
jgi:hypothetical protein